MGATPSLLRNQCGLIKSLLGTGTRAVCPGGGWEGVALVGGLASCVPCAPPQREDGRGSRASESLPSSVSLPNFLGDMRHRLHY